MNRLNINISLLTLGILCSCAANVESKQTADQQKQTDSLAMLDTLSSSAVIEIKPIDVQISKELLYDKYTLEDTYPYKDTTRSYQWEKMKERLALLENIQAEPKRWGILQNYKNRNGEAPLVRNYKRNTYRRIADTLGVERYQSVPLYLLTDTLIPERYGQDGDLVSLLREEGSFTEVEPIFIGSTWMVPQKYIKPLQDTVIFKKAVFIDRTNQNIITLEQKGRAEWMVRSMNPAPPTLSARDTFGHVCAARKKSKNGLFERRFHRDRWLCTLC